MRSLLPYLKKYIKQYVVTVIIMLLNATLAVIVPYMTMQIIDNGIASGNLNQLLMQILVALLIAVIYSVTSSGQSILYSKIGKKLSQDIRKDCVNKLGTMSGEYFTHMDTGEIISVLQRDIRTVESASTTMLLSCISDVLISVSMIIWLGYLQLDLLIFIIALQPLTVIIQVFYKKKLTVASEQLRNASSSLTSLLIEKISKMLSQATSRARELFDKKYIIEDDKYYEKDINMVKTQSLNSMLLNILSGFMLIFVLGYGGYKVISVELTLGGLIAFNIYSQRLFSPITHLAELHSEYSASLISVKNIVNLLQMKSKVNDPPVTDQIQQKQFQGEIRFVNVTFAYDSLPVFSNINFIIPAGHIYGLEGESGSGKTTIVNLLYRLWDVCEGSILVDGIDVKAIPLSILRKLIGIVSQDVYLFDDTLRNNISLGANLDDRTLFEYLKKVGLYEWVLSLNNGLDAMVGESGIRLSGGQRQRISIIRVLLQQAKIIILDEVTSALDSNTENEVLSEAMDLLRDKTILIISHKDSALKWVEKRMILNNTSLTVA